MANTKALSAAQRARIDAAQQMGDNHLLSIDGQNRLNEAFRRMFLTPDGDLVLAYLKNLTMNRASVPPLNELTLAWQEGARWLVAVMDKRVKSQPFQVPKEDDNAGA